MTIMWIVLLVLVVPGLALESHTSYTTSLVRYLSERSSGIFDCWFYQLLDDPWIDELLQSRDLETIPKKLISSEVVVQVDRQPKMLLVSGDLNPVSLKQLSKFIETTNFDETLKIIVLHRCPSRNDLEALNAIFTAAKLFNVLYIRVDQLQLDYPQHYRKSIVSINDPTPPADLFPDQTLNLHGRLHHVSITSATVDARIVAEEGASRGCLIEWIINTLEAVNGTFHFSQIFCEELTPAECTQQQRMLNGVTPVDFAVDVKTLTAVDNRFLSSTFPDQFLVVAPRGRRLTIYEVFAIPFKLELWIMTLVVICFFRLLAWRFPRLFQNDLLLMAICGFERMKLWHVSKLEKFTCLALSIVTFMLFSAYEAKIITFMTSFPYAPSPRTFDDLFQSKIKIFVQNTETYGATNDPCFDQVIQFSPHAWDYIDFNNRSIGFGGSSRQMYMLADHPLYYDFVNKRNKLVLLDQFSLGTFIPFHFVGHRNPLKSRLHRTEQAFLEMGLMDFWTRTLIRQAYGPMYMILVSKGDDSEGSTLSLAELGPVCIVVTAGFCLAALIFVGELGIYWTRKCMNF